jgi:hypothetical protein
MNVRETLQQSAEELERRVEAHRRLMAQAMEGEDAGLDTCSLVDCPHRCRLRETLGETIGR